MSILANSQTKVLCQGIMTPAGLSHTEQAIAYGTNVVAGVGAGAEGETVLGVPVFDTVKKAVEITHPEISVIFASPANAAIEIEAAVDSEVPWIVCPVERIPVQDILRIKQKLKNSKSRLIGPAAPGLISAQECKIGTMPAHLFSAGPVGVMSRSSSLMYEAVQQLREQGIGISSCVALGAYPILGTEFAEIYDLFKSDKKTKIVLLIGEIGGSFEQKFADYYFHLKRKKPLISYVAGSYVPEDTYMGNIGAIVKDEKHTALFKTEKLRQSGSLIIESPADFGRVISSLLEGKK